MVNDEFLVIAKFRPKESELLMTEIAEVIKEQFPGFEIEQFLNTNYVIYRENVRIKTSKYPSAGDLVIVDVNDKIKTSHVDVIIIPSKRKVK